jgi:plastocyanin
MRFARRLLCLFALSPLVVSAADYVLTLSDALGTPVSDAVVSLQPLDQPIPAPVPSAAQPAPTAEVTQLNGEFIPLVSAVRTGTRVTFPNQDRVQHQVYSLSPAKRFEIPLHGAGTAEAEVFDQPGLVAIGCNIHDWMRAYVVVLDTPWFVLTKADGLARLNAPAGRYRLEIWHHRLPRLETREIVLAEAAPLTERNTLMLRRDRRPPRAINTDSSGYR